MSAGRKSQFLSENELKIFFANIEGGYKPPSDQIFSRGNRLLKKYTKKGVISIDEEELHLKESIVCNVPGCNQVLNTVFAYQTHYNSLHLYNCNVCRKNLPSPHLLNLHMLEQHDSFFSVQADRQPMYLCYVEDCNHKSINPEERRDHCIRIHNFPHNFRFDKLTKSKKVSSMDVDNGKEDKNDKEPSTWKPPQYFSFGATQSKAFNRKSYPKNSKSSTKKMNMEVE